MRVGSLFSGIGGLDLGLERAGMEIAWQCEIDPYCQQVLQRHWSGVKLYGDIRTVVQPEPVDLICGGWPCQPFSKAGKRRGKADDRFLWPEMLRVIAEVRPAWVVGENVANIVNMGFDDMLSDLEGLGYEAVPFVIPACAVDAKHRRDRIFVVARLTADGDSLRHVHGQVEEQPTEAGVDALGDVATGADDNRGCVGTGTHQPRLGRMAHGLSSGMDRRWPTEPSGVSRLLAGAPSEAAVARLKALGNAVVPAVAEVLGRVILETDATF